MGRQRCSDGSEGHVSGARTLRTGMGWGSHLAFSTFLNESDEQMGKLDLSAQGPSHYCAANSDMRAFGESQSLGA